MSKKIFMVTLFLLSMLLSACKGQVVPPTIDPIQLETQIAQQVSAQLTQIALNQPAASATVPVIDNPSPTATVEFPSPTATLAPTEIPPTSSPTSVPPTPTNTAPAPTATKKPSPTATPLPFACQVVKQSPENGKVFKRNADFDTIWTVKNIGTMLWDKDDIDYLYDSGDEIHQIEGYDLTKNVNPGESIDLLVDMKAPGEDGKYKTTWILRRGGQLLCTLKLEITVEK